MPTEVRVAGSSDEHGRDIADLVRKHATPDGLDIASLGPMRTEAVKTGYYETLYGKYPKIQILTIRELFDEKKPNIPPVDSASFKKAAKEIVENQDTLPFESYDSCALNPTPVDRQDSRR